MSARAGDGGLSYRLLDTSVDGAFDRDVTGHVTGTPKLTWTAVGGCETAHVTLDLPPSALPTLGEQSKLVVTDRQGRGIWDGYCTSPGAEASDDGEGFDLVATGSMVVASDRVEPLVYIDADPTRWGRASASVASARTDHVDDGAVGWLLAHPEGYPIGPGAAAGIEYRVLEHSAQSIGGVGFTLTAGAADAGYIVRVTTFHDGALVDTVDRAVSTAATVVNLRAGVEISTGVDVVTISLVRTGAATNVTTSLAWVRLAGLSVYGARVDRHGAPVAGSTALVTSRQVIEDLIGRGMLGPVDADRAIVEDSAAAHPQLAWPDGIRGAGVLTDLRADDPDMVWMYGTHHSGGYEFTWARWPETEVRYTVTDADALTRPGSDQQRCHRISVFYTDPTDTTDATRLRRVVVELADPGGARVRDADPLNLGPATAEAARAAGEAELTRLSLAANAATATIARTVRDRVTGLPLEPWELRPGVLARIEATGEVLRVTEVACDTGDNGTTARLTLGDPAQTLEDKLIAFLRGESDPGAPLIKLPPPPVVPPTTGRPASGSDGTPPAVSPTLTWRGGIGSALLTWDQVENHDAVTYKILLGTSPTLLESAATIAGHATGDFFLARTLPNGTPFQNDVTYYARAIATDPDGQAAPGPVVGGTVIAKITQTEISPGAVSTPQLNANAITTDLLLANQAWIGALRATNFYGETITGPIIQTSSTANRGIKLDSVSNALKVWDNWGTLTGSIDGYTGKATFTGSIATAASGARVQLSSASNPFKNGQQWGLVQFFADSTSWMPGQAWAIYDSASGGGQLRFSAPYAVGRSYTDAATIALETTATGGKRIRFNADKYYLGSFGGAVDFNLEGHSTFNLIESSGARLDFELGAAGSGFGATLIDSRTSGGGKRELVMRASQVTFDSGSTGTRAFTMGSNYTSPSSPIFLDANAGDVGNEGAGFSTRKVLGGRIDFVGSYGENYKWVKVWDIDYASDASWKDEVTEIERADSLAQLRKLRPVEYGVKGFDPLNKRTRGLIAQEVKAAVPSAAVGEDGDMGVSSYALITTLVSAVQELADRVDALHPQPPTRSPA